MEMARPDIRALAVATIGFLLSTTLAPLGAGDAVALPRIAILGNGIHPDHPEFAPGQVVAWRDFVNLRAAPYADNSYGTWTASLAAGMNYGSCGAVPKVSFAPGAPLIIGKVLDSRMALTSGSTLASAIRWAVYEGASVISVSIGNSVDTSYFDGNEVGFAISYALSNDVLVVVSAGDGAIIDPAGTGNLVGGVPFPSQMRSYSNQPGTLAVTSANRDGSMDFTPDHTDPAVSTWGNGVCVAVEDGYEIMSGSNAAAALVSGMAAAARGVASANGHHLTYWETEALLLRSATNAVAVPYAREGMGFLFANEWSRISAAAAADRLPNYDAQGPHAIADREYHDRVSPRLRTP